MPAVASPPPLSPEAEQRRLARLRMLTVLDTAPEPAFDALVRIAAGISGMPIALISLIDSDRQWFKANLGLEGVSETPREYAFCDHAIRGAAVFEVQDAARDARFEANPLVTGDPRIRFYAGAPISMPTGERIGTICVIGREPGRLTAKQQAALRDLAEVAQWMLRQRAAYELLDTVVQSLPCGLSVFDADLRLIARNQQYQSLLDFPDALFSAPQPHFEDFIRYNAQRGEYGSGDAELVVRRLVELARQPEPHSLQRERPGGVALEIRGAPLPGGGFVTTYTDVTPAKTAENALRLSEERQKRALDASRLALWDLDLTTGDMYLSENWSVFLGGPPAVTVTTLDALEQLLPAEERLALGEAMRDAMVGSTPRYAVEHRVRRYDGSWMWIRSEGGVTERDANGIALHATGTNQDITARKAAEAELARAAAITRATLEATTDGILVMGPDREVLLHNQQFLQMWNIPPRLARASVPELVDFVRGQVKDPDAFAREVEAQYQRIDPNGSNIEFRDGRVIERHVRLMTLEDGRAGRVWSFRDVTTQRAAQAEVRLAKEAAEAANRAKSDFLDNVSHEIRTPLNGVLGLTRLLLAEKLSEQQRKYVQLAEGSAASLLELINDLLDLGKIESGRMDLEVQPFRLDELLAQLTDLYRLRAADKGLRFVFEMDGRVPPAVAGDAGRLRQILNNLLSNACKFTANGEFGLIVGPTEAGRGSGMLRFTVFDTGIGIPPDVQQRLFTRFTQADAATSRKYGGTGLGLAIVKQLCDMMGGTVLLQSEPGRGASFRCELPLAPVQLAATLPAPGVAGVGVAWPTRILVAEDNPTNQVVVRGLLAQAGYANVTLVDDGQEALDALAAGEFDLVLMDCRMPRVDGYQAARELRARGFTQPIIALTANAAPGERERCLAWGMNEYLSKPIEPRRLAQVLAEWTGNAVQAGAANSAGDWQGGGGFEREASLQQLGGDEDLLAVALAAFRSSAPAVLRAAAEALASGAGSELHRHLHSLSGSAGMLGAVPLQAAARELEQRAAAGRMDGLERELGDLSKLLDRFLAESSGW